MSDLAAALDAAGIRLRDYRPGDHRTTCPQCSAQRKKKTDPCLSVTIEESGRHAVWHCHHCDLSGGTKEPTDSAAPQQQDRRRKPPVRPTFNPNPNLPVALIEWFKGRGIPEAVLKRNKVSAARVWMPEPAKEVGVVAFPYYRGGELINVKYRRVKEKQFRQEKDAEKIFYGLDDLVGAKDAIIVEGEPDKLACEVAGILNVVSVPDGAPKMVSDREIDPEDDKKFEYVWNCREYFEDKERIIIATDADGPGQALAEELARRFGRERCWRVHWPQQGDAQRKDANEVLLEDGAQVLRECVEYAEPWPIKSLFTVAAFADAVHDLYDHGPGRSFTTGWPAMNEFYKVRPGEVTVVTGEPGSGKSEWVDALQVQMADKHGWKFALCSFENPPAEHLGKLLEKRCAAPFFDGPTWRMQRPELDQALAWLGEHFFFIRAEDEAPTIDWILETAQGAVARYGIRGLTIDPYNEIEHKRPGGMTETEYVSQMLGKVKRFAANAGVHVWFIAHPAKIQRNRDGSTPIPTLNDISGSKNWVSKADVGIVVHRDYDAEQEGNRMVGKTAVHIRKVRFKAVGRPGTVYFEYDRATGLYSVDTRKTHT